MQIRQRVTSQVVAAFRGRHRRHHGPDGVAVMPGAAEGNMERQMDHETMKRLGG